MEPASAVARALREAPLEGLEALIEASSDDPRATVASAVARARRRLERERADRERVAGLYRTMDGLAEGGLAVGASLEDLGKGLRSQVGTMFATHSKGPRYLEMAEGYCTRMALNKDDEVIGYEFVNLGKMMDFIKKGDDANTALEKAKGHYGQFDAAVKYIDPRHE